MQQKVEQLFISDIFVSEFSLGTTWSQVLTFYFLLVSCKHPIFCVTGYMNVKMYF